MKEKERLVPKFEWKEGNNIAVYCHTHNSIIFVGKSKDKLSMRVMKGRIQEHCEWWEPDDHDLDYIFPNNEGGFSAIGIEYKFKSPKNSRGQKLI